MKKQSNFSQLALSEAMLGNLERMNYLTMSEIQKKAIPSLLEGEDVLAQSHTGSGKSATFGIALIEKLQPKSHDVQSLILCPTRELAKQVSEEIRQLAKAHKNVKVLTLCGGESYYRQEQSLYHRTQIVVGTPGRILKHIKKETLQVNNLRTLVLDEADKMLEMGFLEEIEEIMGQTPLTRQTLLFSATYSDEILAISKLHQKNALHIVANKEEKLQIQEYLYKTENKFETLLHIFNEHKPLSSIIFVNTKIEAQELGEKLQNSGVDTLSFHGDYEQYERDDILVQFSNGSCSVLVASDLASRGLDIKNLEMVISYDLARDFETYIHRRGRTGRSGKSGLCATLYTYDELEKIDEYVEKGVQVIENFKISQGLKNKIEANFTTLIIEGGKKHKLSKGDILGSLTKSENVEGTSIGMITIYERYSYVALKREEAQEIAKKCKNMKIKGKHYSSWLL